MSELPNLDLNNLPKHIAIIMDGNGRWAENRGMPRAMGHKVGVESVQEVVKAARELGIASLTLYAFSTENWQRPTVEVQALMGLLKSYLQSELTTMVENNVRLRCIGQKQKLPNEVREILDQVINETADNTGLSLNLALSYGGRNEIVRTTQILAQQCVEGVLKPDGITEDIFADHLDTSGQPDLDLLIRTGGESRLSNFLLWQASYAEIYITDTLWPDFRKAGLTRAVYDFQCRQRRFGKTGNQVTEEKKNG